MKTLHELFNYLHEHVEAFFKHDSATNTYTVHQSMSHPIAVARVTPRVIQDMERDNMLERYATGYKVRQQRVREIYTPRREDSSSSLGSTALGAGFGIAAGLALSNLFDGDDHSSSISHHDDDSFTGGGGGFSGGGSSESPSYDPPSHSDSSSSDWGSSSSDSSSSDSSSSDSSSSDSSSSDSD
jgi:hypothetical protein